MASLAPRLGPDALQELHALELAPDGTLLSAEPPPPSSGPRSRRQAAHAYLTAAGDAPPFIEGAPQEFEVRGFLALEDEEEAAA